MTDHAAQLEGALRRLERSDMTSMSDQPPGTVWLTTDQVAERLRVSRKTVERLRASGRLPTFRAWQKGQPRFRQQDVDGLMETEPAVSS